MKINPINTLEYSHYSDCSIECVICEHVLALDTTDITATKAKLITLGWGAFNTILGLHCPVACPACIEEAQQIETYYQPYIQKAKDLLGTSIDDCKSTLHCMLSRNPDDVINVATLCIQSLENSQTQKTKNKLFHTFHNKAAKILNE